MCRLSAITSNKYFSPMENIHALDTMKEGHDGSGLGLVLKDLGGEFESLKEHPILSGICSHAGLEALNEYMFSRGFREIYFWEPRVNRRFTPETGPRDHYFAKVYSYPENMKNASREAKEELLLDVRLSLRAIGEPDESIFVFSFYPDVISLKEVGDPMEVAEYFRLEQEDSLKAKIVFAQGRQNTNYAIYLYACHPFFLQGYCSMTNGENTAFVPIREFLSGRGFPGYTGYNSDSEVFTHILHYTQRQLGYPLRYFKDVITPLKEEEMEGRRDREALKLVKRSLRPLCIDGPNCTIGFTPDGSLFMVQDAKKLRPGVVGGVPGKYALMSEECGLDRAVPTRDKSQDFSPMKYDMAVIAPQAKEMKVWTQLSA